MVYSNEDAHDMLNVMFEAGSFAAAERLWRERYPNRFPHSRKVFSRLSTRIRTIGIVQPHHNKGKIIRRRVRDLRSVDIIASAIVTPRDSTRRRERDSGISKSTVSLILRASKFHPYRMELHQALNNIDIRQRLEFCNWMRRQPEDFHRRILWSDESVFKSDASVNTWNCRHWTQQNPHWLITIDNQRIWKVNVWCGIIGDQILGPIFFDENLDRFRYAALIEQDLPNLLENLPLQLRLNMWFQQDGAPAHTARMSRQILNGTFPNRWIGKFGPVNYPPRSPDLTVLDYYLWGRIKDLVYRDRPTTRADMMRTITRAIQSLDAAEILRAVDNIAARVQLCIRQGGAQFEH